MLLNFLLSLGERKISGVTTESSLKITKPGVTARLRDALPVRQSVHIYINLYLFNIVPYCLQSWDDSL